MINVALVILMSLARISLAGDISSSLPTSLTNASGSQATTITSEPSSHWAQDVACYQSTSPWVSNITQFGSNNVVTGTGTSGVGIPRVTVSTDTSLSPWQNVVTTGSISANGGTVVQSSNGLSSTTVVISGTWVGTLQIQGSADGSSFVNLLTATGASGTYANTAITTNGSYRVYRIAPNQTVQVIATAWTSGTANIVMDGSVGQSIVEPVQTTAANLNVQAVGNIASAAADSGNPVKVGAKYNATAPTFTDGNRTDLQSDVNGRLLTSSQPQTIVTTDINASALTASGQTSSISMAGAPGVSAFINVTAVSGTNPTMDLVLQGTIDGTNWDDIYGIQRITAATSVVIRDIRLPHPTYRWKYTIAGTTPSFTTTITTMKRGAEAVRPQHSFFQYGGLNLTTTGNVSTPVQMAACSNFTIEITRVGGGGSGGGVNFGVYGSLDAVDYFQIGANTGNVSTTAFTTLSWNAATMASKYFRVQVAGGGGASQGTASLYWFCNN